jgi:hypothetical protein
MERNLSRHGVGQLKFWLETVCLESVHTLEHIDRAIESVESSGGFEVSPQRTKSKLPETITAEEDWYTCKFSACWIGGGIDNGRYEITGLPWYSHNGDYWYEQGTSMDQIIDSDDFHASTITLIGGPRNGEVIV